MVHGRTLCKAGVALFTAALCIAPALCQQTNGPATPRRGMDPEAAARTATLGAGDTSPAAQEVLEFERKMEAAVVSGDVAYVSSVLADDFEMVHGDTWTTGGKAMLIDNKQSFLKRVENKQYLARDLDSVKVELHGDIAITYGRYVAQNRIGPPDRSWFSVWFERVYAKKDGKWVYLSHRTVHGPTYGPDRDSVKDK